MLAGISAEYYLRLEQGRDRHPSGQVLESLAWVLQLEDDDYLVGLSAASPRRAPRRTRREVLPPSTARLVAALPFPAFVEGRHLDVLASNTLARSLSPRLAPGFNRLRDLFLDPAEQALFTDWERAVEALLAGFRRSVGTDVHDTRVIELVGELSLVSPAFVSCGHATTSVSVAAPTSSSTILRSVRSGWTARSSASAEPTVSCW